MKAETSRQHARLEHLGYAVFGALLLLAAVFYRERALFTDIAYQTFLLINDGGLQVQVFRFGAGVVQVLPLLALKLGAPLWVISFSYSISFPLLYLLFYWLIVRFLGNPYLGWVLVFLFTLTIYDGFYWPSSEQQQGLAFLLVFWAFVLRFPALSRWWALLVAALGIIALAFYHPLIFIPFFFLWGYFGWQEKALRHWRFLGLAVFMMMVLGLKAQIAANWYDSNKYGVFFANLVNDFPNYFQYPSHQKFLQHSLYYWYGLPITLLLLTGFYMLKRRWALLAWVWAFCLGHLMLLHIGSPNATYRFYAEVNYLPLVIYTALPLVLEWAKPAWGRPLVFYLFFGIVGLRLVAIGLHHRPYTQRLEWLARQMDRGPAGANRYFLPQHQVPMDTLIIEWGTAYESLLLSAMEHPDSAQTLLVLPDAGQYSELFDAEGTFFSGLKRHDLEELNPRYFRLGRGQYQVLE